MNELSAVVYVSSLVGGISEAQINVLLMNARERNQQYGITGVLLYCDGCYMQYLEGPPDAVSALYRNICADHDHHSVIEMFFSVIESREFKNWAMAYSVISEKLFLDLTRASWVTRPDAQVSIGQTLLSAFWKNNRPQ